MNKEKQRVYLSELFLKKLNGDFSRRAVLKALKKCNDEILQRVKTCQCSGDFICFFFSREGQKQELADFWDVYSEFDDMLRPEVKKTYLILQMI